MTTKSIRKPKRENWKTGYRNVLRDSKGHFVSWDKWIPTHTVTDFYKVYKAKPKQLYKYSFAVYSHENTKKGTSVKLELYVKNFVTDLKPDALEKKYKHILAKQLQSEVGKPNSKYGKEIKPTLKSPHFMILKDIKTSERKSKTMYYDASVLNIAPNASESKRIIRTTEGYYEI